MLVADVMIVAMMIIIGAVIGGLTNSLAIKMLFRPYEAKYIGNWKLPFTPGLIPKRRDDLAKQLGKTVVDHLLTPEGLRKKLQQPEFQKQMVDWAQEEVSRMAEADITVKELLAKLEINVNEQDVRNKISEKAASRCEELINIHRTHEIKEVLNDEWLVKTEQGVHQLASHIQYQLSDYVASDEAKRKIGGLVDTYLEGKGFFGNMISSFLGNESLADKIQPVVVDYIKSQEAWEWIDQLIMNEYQRLLAKPVDFVEAKLGSDKISSEAGKIVANALPIEAWLNKSVHEWLVSFKPYIIMKLVPLSVNKIGEALTERIDTMMERLHLAEIVEKEVETFPLQRVEELVLNISRKEFKMITYLGAVLGGAIGLVQGIIVIILG